MSAPEQAENLGETFSHYNLDSHKLGQVAEGLYLIAFQRDLDAHREVGKAATFDEIEVIGDHEPKGVHIPEQFPYVR